MGVIIAVMYFYPKYLANPSEDSVNTELTVDDKSIAVIPFINMSDDPSQ